MPVDTPIQLTQGQFNEEMNKIWKNHMNKPVKYTRDFGPNGDGYVVPDEGENWYGATPIGSQYIQFTPKNFFELFSNRWKDEIADTIGSFDLLRRGTEAYWVVKGGLWLIFPSPQLDSLIKSGGRTVEDLWSGKGLEIHWINRVAAEGEHAQHDEDYYRLNEKDYEFLSVGWNFGVVLGSNKNDKYGNLPKNLNEIAISQICLNLKNMEKNRKLYFYLGDSLEDFNKLKVQSPHLFNWLNWMQDPMEAK